MKHIEGKCEALMYSFAVFQLNFFTLIVNVVKIQQQQKSPDLTNLLPGKALFYMYDKITGKTYIFFNFRSCKFLCHVVLE